MQMEVHDSPNRVVMEDTLCSSPFMVGRSSTISYELEVPLEENSFVHQRRMLEQDSRGNCLYEGTLSTSMFVSPSPLACDDA